MTPAIRGRATLEGAYCHSEVITRQALNLSVCSTVQGHCSLLSTADTIQSGGPDGLLDLLLIWCCVCSLAYVHRSFSCICMLLFSTPGVLVIHPRAYGLNRLHHYNYYDSRCDHVIDLATSPAC